MKRVLIVSPYFPPSMAAGAHRARFLAKYLPDWGWEPIIFCVDEKFYGQPLDYDLADLVPKSTRIIKVSAWPLRVSGSLGLRDASIRGYLQMKKAINNFLSREGAEVLFITVLPGFSMLMGPSIKARYKIPVVLDFQDPWVSEWGKIQRPWSKAGIAHRLATWIEPHAVSCADYITSVSAGTNRLLKNLHPMLSDERMKEIPIGIDFDDFNALKTKPRLCPWLDHKEGIMNVCYVGNIWPNAMSTLRDFLAACVRVKKERPALFSKIKFLFVGTSNQSDGFNDYKVLLLAKEMGLESQFVEVPQRLPYLDALNILSHADLVLMIGSNEAHYTASKLYPCLMSGRPVFAVFHEKSLVSQTVQKIGGVCLVTFNDEIPSETRLKNITDNLIQVLEGKVNFKPLNRDMLKIYSARSIAREFADVFNKVLTDEIK